MTEATMAYAVLSHESWDASRIFAAPTYEQAEQAAWAYARACWEEWADDTSDDAWLAQMEGNWEWSVQEANMHG